MLETEPKIPLQATCHLWIHSGIQNTAKHLKRLKHFSKR